MTDHEDLMAAGFITNTPRPGETPEQIAARYHNAALAAAPQNGHQAELEIAQTKAKTLVDGILRNTVAELTRRRDEIDTAIARIQSNGSALAHFITQFAARNYEALELAGKVQKLIDEAMSPFPKTPPSTISASKEDSNAP